MYYVIYTQTGKEEKVIDAIKNKLHNNEDFEVFSPYRKSLRKYKGEFKEVIERCFPGYLFVETDKPKELFFDLYWVDEYTKLLGREGITYNFTPLNDEESRMIDILYNKNNNRTTEISDIEVVPGDVIRVLDGPLEGLEGTIKKVDLHKRNVTIEFPFCNRKAEAKLAINIITRKNRSS